MIQSFSNDAIKNEMTGLYNQKSPVKNCNLTHSRLKQFTGFIHAARKA